MKGQGKTTHLRKLLNSERRLIVIDPKKQFRGDGLVLTSADDLLSYFEKFNPQTFRCVCRFRDDKEFSQTETALALAYELHDLTVCVDEVDMICTPYNMIPSLWNIVNYGRNDGINLYTSARRAAAISITLRAEADEVVTFRVEEPADWDYLQKRGFNIDVVKNLEKFHYISNKP